MQESKFFNARKIDDNVTLISGLAGEQCYLIEGGEKAMLVDGLAGVGSLKAFVRELTDLPVEIVLTHCHGDHIGAAFEYGAAYIHPDDIRDFYDHGDAEGRFAYATGGGHASARFEDTVPSRPIRAYPVRDGDVLDLGDVRLEVIEVPGHTWGHIVLLDRKARVIYSGDAVNRNTLLCLGGTSIEQYRESLLHLKSYEDAYDLMWGGHGNESVTPAIVDEAIRLCDEILAGTDDQIPADFMGRPALYARAKDKQFRRLDGGVANIAYSRDRVWKKQVARL